MHLTDGTRRRFLSVAASVIAAPLVATAASRGGYELRVLLGENGDTTQQILKAITVRFPHARIADAVAVQDDRKGTAVYLTLGAAALQSALSAGLSAPILALFTSNEAFTRVVANLRPDQRVQGISAVFAEASPLHQLRLVRALYKRRVGIAALLSAGTAHLQSLIEEAARANDLDLHLRLVDPRENAVRALLTQRDEQALLMVPDRNLYTAESLRTVLESAYRRTLGVIGFSPALVRAGVLAAAYSTIDDVLSQVGAAADALAQGHTPSPQYSTYWRVLINERVANSLDVVVSDSDRALGNLPN